MKLKSILALVLCIGTVLAACGGQQGGGKTNLKTANDSAAYAIGVLIGEQMKGDGLDSLDVNIMAAAVGQMLKGDTTLLIKKQNAQGFLMTYMQTKQKAKAEAAKGIGAAWLEKNKTKSGVKTTATGLQYEIIKTGDGALPIATDTITVHYHGTLTDGTIFDSSVDRGQPIDYCVKDFIPGWIEALTMMPVGSKWKLYVPSELGYGERGSGKIPPNSVLVFDLELIAIKSK